MKKSLLISLIVLAFTVLQSEPQSFQIDGACQVAFSPKGGITDMLVAYIGTAKKSIRVLAYNFTSEDIGDALVAAKKRGVDVELVLDRSVPTEKNSILPLMLENGIPSWIDKKHHIAHNKVIIVDGAWIETGSFNYSSSAENNNGENAIICPSISGAKIYTENWELHKSHSVPVKQ